MMKDAGPCEDPAPDSDLLQGDVKGPLLSAEHLSVIRSRSPVFPLSPQSTASSSSDILRDVDEAAVCEESNPTLADGGFAVRNSEHICFVTICSFYGSAPWAALLLSK
ncbi:hypothetical protein FKM82_004380 [Ascaphus truei]